MQKFIPMEKSINMKLKKPLFKSSFWITAGVLLLALCVVAPTAISAPSDHPLEITANQMDLYPDQKKVTFSGNVVAIQGTSKITSAVLTAFYTSGSEGLPGMKKRDTATSSPVSKNEGASGALDKIVATGSVVIVFDDMTAKADRAEFDPKTDIITLHGEGKNVEVRNDQGIIRGKTIVTNRDTGETVVKSAANQRVQAVVFSTGELAGKVKKEEGATP